MLWIGKDFRFDLEWGMVSRAGVMGIYCFLCAFRVWWCSCFGALKSK